MLLCPCAPVSRVTGPSPSPAPALAPALALAIYGGPMQGCHQGLRAGKQLISERDLTGRDDIGPLGQCHLSGRLCYNSGQLILSIYDDVGSNQLGL